MANTEATPPTSSSSSWLSRMRDSDIWYLVVDSVLNFRANGVAPADKDVVFSVLSLSFEEAQDGAGTFRLTLAGDGELALEVECVDIRLQDVSRPYQARAGSAPNHQLDD